MNIVIAIIIGIIVGFVVGGILAAIISISDTDFLCGLFICIPICSIGSAIMAYNIISNVPKENNSIEVQYSNIILKEEFELYKTASKDDIAKFKKAYVDKCVNLPEDMKINVMNAYMNASFDILKMKHKENSKADYRVENSINNDESLKSESYSTFLKTATKFTDFRAFTRSNNNHVLEFSFKTEVPNENCICGRCKKTKVNTFQIEMIK